MPLFIGLASLVARLVKNPLAMQKTCIQSWVGKIAGRRKQLPTPVFWPREFHGLYSPWDHKESDTTEQLSVSVSIYHGKEIIFTTIYFCINFKVYIDMSSNKVSISNQQMKEN